MAGPDRSAGTVQVQGLRQLRRTLRQAGDDLSDLKRINREVADIVTGAAEGRVPTLTGALAASVRGAGTKTATIVRAGRARVPYAGVIHWGRHYWPRKGHPRAVPSQVEARPFLSDAATSTESIWVGRFEDEIQKILETIGGK